MEYIPYKGKTNEDLWLYLDELERLNLDRDAHTDIDIVLEKISKEPSGLRRMVKRYCNTSSAYVFGYVAAAISHFARVMTRRIPPDAAILDEITELSFEMLNKVRWLTVGPDNLPSLLNTVQMVIWTGGWNKNIVPNNFAGILQRCLRFGWINEAQADFIKRGAVQVLMDMSKAGILTSSFDKEQLKWFEEEVKRYQSRLEPGDPLKNVTLDFSQAEDLV